MSSVSSFAFLLLITISLKFNCGFCRDARLASCGLVGIPANTSIVDPYTLPAIPDNLQPNIISWECLYEGNITRTTVLANSDHAYLSAILERTNNTYRIFANNLTQSFVQIEGRRMMTRYVTVYCADGQRTRYFFHIPVLDVIPPRFEQNEYTFNVPSSWNRDMPISYDQWVIVSDNAFEIGEGSLNITFHSSVEDIVRLEPVQLWSGPNQERYYYRLDVFISEAAEMIPGDILRTTITAKDELNASESVITINVT